MKDMSAMSKERMTSLQQDGGRIYGGLYPLLSLGYNAISDEFSKCPSVDV